LREYLFIKIKFQGRGLQRVLFRRLCPLGREVRIFEVSDLNELEKAFATAVEERAGGLVVLSATARTLFGWRLLVWVRCFLIGGLKIGMLARLERKKDLRNCPRV
jgi:hypothetical protein